MSFINFFNLILFRLHFGFFFFCRTCPQQVSSTLDTNKYKFLTKFTLDDLEIVKGKIFLFVYIENWKDNYYLINIFCHKFNFTNKSNL